MGWYSYRKYVPVSKRIANAKRKMKQKEKKGLVVEPIEIEGRKICQTFWGQSWCKNLERYSDYSNRLPRGKSYVRNGSVVHLAIGEGTIKANVSGTDLYDVYIEIKKVTKKRWQQLVKDCSGKIESALDLLSGELSDGLMKKLIEPSKGLFPSPKEIGFQCSCPDWAYMCKHVAAVLYGVGARLDQRPELLFKLRGVNHEDLISEAHVDVLAITGGCQQNNELAGEDLSELFGIELATDIGLVTKKSLKRNSAKVVKPKPQKTKKANKQNTKPKPKTRRDTIKVRKGTKLTSKELINMGVPRSTFNNWLYNGILLRTEQRGLYKATSQTKKHILETIQRLG